MEPLRFGDINRAGEAGAVGNLPVTAGVKHRGVLHRVGLAGLMLAEIDLFVVVAVGVEANIESEEATDGRCRDVDVDNTVTHLEVLKDRGAAVDEQAFAALI